MAFAITLHPNKQKRQLINSLKKEIDMKIEKRKDLKNAEETRLDKN